MMVKKRIVPQSVADGLKKEAGIPLTVHFLKCKSRHGIA